MVRRFIMTVVILLCMDFVIQRWQENKMEWKFKKNAEPQGSSDGFWYDLTKGGYIKPEEVLSDTKQLKQLQEAIDLVMSFEESLEAEELLKEF